MQVALDRGVDYNGGAPCSCREIVRTPVVKQSQGRPSQQGYNRYGVKLKDRSQASLTKVKRVGLELTSGAGGPHSGTELPVSYALARERLSPSVGVQSVYENFELWRKAESTRLANEVIAIAYLLSFSQILPKLVQLFA